MYQKVCAADDVWVQLHLDQPITGAALRSLAAVQERVYSSLLSSDLRLLVGKELINPNPVEFNWANSVLLYSTG